MAYTDIDDPTIYFETLSWTGNGNTPRTFTGLDFAPNMTWSKRRDDAAGHNLLDTVRGAGVDSELCPSTNGVEGSNNANAYGYLSAFTSDGFTVTAGSSDNAYWNNNTATYVAWNWKAGSSISGATVGLGTLKTYTGSVSTTAGFSIIKYTGNGTSGHQFPHGLGVAPKVVIVKRTNTSAQWNVFHASLGSTGALYLNDTIAFNVVQGFWNNSAPNSTSMPLGTDAAGNGDGDTYIAYCFAEKKGYSKFGSYKGNGNADGAFINLGFKPAWVIVKLTSGSGEHWYMQDATRNTFNPSAKRIKGNAGDAELDNTAFNIDFLSNGMKMRNTNAGHNGSGSTFIYMAFAESPFVNSNGVPNNAR